VLLIVIVIVFVIIITRAIAFVSGNGYAVAFELYFWTAVIETF
jgi:hypothetical protein